MTSLIFDADSYDSVYTSSRTSSVTTGLSTVDVALKFSHLYKFHISFLLTSI